MPLKRRIDHSSRNLSTSAGTATAAAGPSNPAKVLKPCMADTTEQPPPKLWSLDSPVVQPSVELTDEQKSGEFLERCHYCKKKISNDSEIYMYSDLCAFCSVECRSFQIAIDRFSEKETAFLDESMVKGAAKVRALSKKTK